MNSNYGHRAILAGAAGMDNEPPILGILQHGWTPYDGWAEDAPLPRYVPRLVWSRRSLTRVPSNRTPAAYSAIGSPFAYLIENDRSRLLVPSAGEKTIVFPQHSAENVQITDPHEPFAAELRSSIGKVTVCLYWIDYAIPGVRAAYEAAGHNVITIGSTRDDRMFIPKFLRALEGHGRVVSNRLSTALLYAAALDRQVEVMGAPLTVRGEVEHGISEAVDSLRLLKSETQPEGASVPVPRDWARQELGWEDMLPARRLAETLGWRGRRQWLGTIAGTYASIRRQIKK
ncbi:hypothetical protein [Microbacterium sp.]|uniref:hypothetical protein n=1 Tax=Microbacterium sp. TaxID=51671 RepID=UPI0037C79A53